MSPYFDKYFILYNFASKTSYVDMFTQKYLKDNEIPVSFMISRLHENNSNTQKWINGLL